MSNFLICQKACRVAGTFLAARSSVSRIWCIFRELVRPNFLDLREFIIIFALRNNRASSALPSVTSSLPYRRPRALTDEKSRLEYVE